MRRTIPTLWAAAGLIASPAVAWAGMPMLTLTDVARLRVQTISFFLAGFLLSAWALQRLWNRLGRDFAFLPRLSYGKAVGVVALWGLLFILVLTMISGARELMTPGAWKKDGLTYRLEQESAAPPAEDALEKERRKKLEDLRTFLWAYAMTHESRFPVDNAVPEIPREHWQLPDASGLRYLYVGGQTAGQKAVPLAYEPEVYGSQRLVLLTNGEIRRMGVEEIERTLKQEER